MSSPSRSPDLDPDACKVPSAPSPAPPATADATTQTHNAIQTVRFVVNGQVAALERERDHYKAALHHEQKLLRVAMDLVQLRDEEIAELKFEKKVVMVVLERLVNGLRAGFPEERKGEGEEVGGAAGADGVGEGEKGREKDGEAEKSEGKKQEAGGGRMPKLKLKAITREQARERAMMTDLNQLSMNGRVVRHERETASSQEERPVASDGGA